MTQPGNVTQLQMSMCLMLDTFEKYAKTDGDPNSLSKSEVKTLLEKEMPGMISGAKDQKAVDDLFKALDFDGNGVMDFEEFMVVVAALTCAFRGVPTTSKK
ncbi:protein S100-G-like [Neolamprologus brichardi]|uniref:protein S100-G-like n=1 Tax=Neolamprologus brichardi TaxID=32507 RepID=UPI0003EBEA48|nr:protein S100-G-like [Neolamprologus brichardi]